MFQRQEGIKKWSNETRFIGKSRACGKRKSGIIFAHFFSLLFHPGDFVNETGFRS